MNQSVGNLYVIAAPSGTGKTSLVKALTESLPNITVSISHTTRPRRPAEVHGINYYFIDESTFLKMIADKAFLEHATVFDHLYGTSKQWVENTLAEGKDVILEIDWQGSQQIHTLFKEATSIFLLPPSLSALATRLYLRKQDTTEIIQQRLADVRESTAHIQEFHYVVMNDHFEKALEDLKTIILAGRLKQKCQVQKYEKLLIELTHMKNLSAAMMDIEKEK